MEFRIFAFLQRLCGADIVITPAKYGTFYVMTAEQHRKNIDALMREIPGCKPSFPAFCGGQSAETVPMLSRDVGSDDFIVVSGTALYDHPGGPRAGAEKIKDAMLASSFEHCVQ